MGKGQRGEVERESGRLVEMISLNDLLKARALNLDAEQRRERVLGAHIALPFGARRSAAPPARPRSPADAL